MATSTPSPASKARRTPSARAPKSPPARRWPEWVGSWPRLKGRQLPEFESKFDGDEHAQADRCGRFGAAIGMRQMPWQWRSLQGILSVQPPTPEEIEDAEAEGREPVQLFTHRDVCIECTRQQGKTLLVVLLILFHMFVLRSKRIIYTAQRWSTAYDVFKRVVAVINRVPWLKSRLAEKPSKGGNRGVIKLVNGCEVEFGPRSQDFGRGYTEIDLLIIDEAYDLDPDEEANLTGTQSAAKNPQTIYISTPPVAAAHPRCHILAGLHRLGFDRAPDLYYALYAAPEGMSRDDPEAWALAQPSYGVATNEREIRSKRQKAKTAAQRAIFDADYLGWGDYPPPEDEIGSPITEDQWQNLLVDPVGVQLVGPRGLALERTRDGKVWTLAVAQRTTDGRIFVEVGYSRTAPNGSVKAYTVAAVGALNPVALVTDQKSSAAVLEQELIDAGIEPTMTNMPQLALASRGFLDDALDGRLAHAGQECLTDAVASASMRELPSGGFTWDESYGGAPVAHLKAATLARWALIEFGATAKKPAKPVKAHQGAGRKQSRETNVMEMAF